MKEIALWRYYRLLSIEKMGQQDKGYFYLFGRSIKNGSSGNGLYPFRKR